MTDQYNPPKADTLEYRLNRLGDTAYMGRDSQKEEYSIHIYNPKGQLIKRQVFSLGKKEEYSYPVKKNKPVEIMLEKKTILDKLRVDTTKKYYDSRGNLILLIETNNLSGSKFRTVYTYDRHDNLIDEKFYVFNGAVRDREQLSKHSKIIYKYDRQGNWIFKEVSYVSILTGEPYQTITAKRAITYNL